MGLLSQDEGLKLISERGICDDIRQIHQACRQANDLDMRQADAVATRISLDLKVGSAFTRLTTMTLQVRVPDLAEQLISYGKSFLLASPVFFQEDHTG